MSIYYLLPCVDDYVIPPGCCIVMDKRDRLARLFSPSTDYKSDIIGVSVPKARIFDKDTVECLDNYRLTKYRFTEYLEPLVDENNSYVLNPNYNEDFDPMRDDSYVAICVMGLVAIQRDQPVLPTWWIIDNSAENETDIYLVK